MMTSTKRWVVLINLDGSCVSGQGGRQNELENWPVGLTELETREFSHHFISCWHVNDLLEQSRLHSRTAGINNCSTGTLFSLPLGQVTVQLVLWPSQGVLRTFSYGMSTPKRPVEKTLPVSEELTYACLHSGRSTDKH